MRFATYSCRGSESCGVVVDDHLHPLPEGVTVLDLVLRGGDELMAAGAAAIAGSTETVPIAEVQLLPPFRPASIRDFIAFEAHVAGLSGPPRDRSAVPARWYEAPAFYFTNPHAVIGAHDPVPVFSGCEVFDFECEVAAVVGRPGRDLTPDQARDHIVGYTIFNDWSARDIQRLESALPVGFAKAKDGAHTLGPYLVTVDELESARQPDGFLDLTMTIELNGEVVGEDSLASMSWTFEELVAYASSGAQVGAGDVLASGTCGRGCLAEIWGRAGEQVPAPLRPGDLVTLTVERLGTVSNRVVAGGPPIPIPAARTQRWGRRH